MQQLTGDYPAAAASQQQALALFRDVGTGSAEATALNHLGLDAAADRDYPAAAASQQQALALFRDIGNLSGQADALNDLGVVQQLTGTTLPPPPATAGAGAVPRPRQPARPGLALNDLGLVQQQTGDYAAAAASYQQALALFHDLGNRSTRPKR